MDTPRPPLKQGVNLTIFVPPPPIPLCVPHPDVCTQEMEEVKKGGGVRIKREREKGKTL